jgi:hypothetical protein
MILRHPLILLLVLRSSLGQYILQSHAKQHYIWGRRIFILCGLLFNGVVDVGLASVV